MTKNEQVNFRCDTDFYLEIARASNEQGVDMAKFVRECVKFVLPIVISHPGVLNLKVDEQINITLRAGRHTPLYINADHVKKRPQKM